jgi:hypothetical protein
VSYNKVISVFVNFQYVLWYPFCIVISNALLYISCLITGTNFSITILGVICKNPTSPLSDEGGVGILFTASKALLLLFFIPERKQSKYGEGFLQSFYSIEIYSGIVFFPDNIFYTNLSYYFFPFLTTLVTSKIYLHSFYIIPLLFGLIGQILFFLKSQKSKKALLFMNYKLIMSISISIAMITLVKYILKSYG